MYKLYYVCPVLTTGIGKKKIFLLCHHGEEIIEWNYIVFKCAVAPFMVLLLLLPSSSWGQIHSQVVIA